MTMDAKELMDEARAAMANKFGIRVHGNGFLQLDLDEQRRLHVWGDRRIPRQRVSHPIHDHVFGFESEVIVGRLVNLTYIRFRPVLPESDHARYFQAHQAQPVKKKGGHDTLLAPLDDGNWWMEAVKVDVVHAGLSYAVAAFEYHETLAPEPAASVITKDGDTLVQNPKGRRPTVMIPNGRGPDNEFRREALPQAKLAEILTDVLKGEGQW